MTDMNDDINPEDYALPIPKDINLAPPKYEKFVPSDTNFMQDLSAIPSKARTNHTPDAQETDMYKKFLSKFYNTSEDVLTEAIKDDPKVKKLLTESENTSDKEWHIIVENDLFNIVNSKTDKCFFEGIHMKNTAKNLCKSLNRGAAINSQQISSILNVENRYVKYLNETLTIKERYENLPESTSQVKREIMETKFHNAKDNAMKAIKYQKSLYERL